MAYGKTPGISSEEYLLGQNIRKYRKQKGLSQTQLADLMDIDHAAISNYENGAKGEMGFKMLRKFSRVLEVSVDVLLNEKTDEELNAENQAIIQKMKEALLIKQNLAL